ncbi:MAG: signal peptidase II [Verrucomicrobiota bacterium]
MAFSCTAGGDLVSKHIARGELSERGFITLPVGLGEFRLAENPGSFLSFGDSLPKPLGHAIFTIGVGIALVSMLAYLVFGGRLTWLMFVGLGLVWAGGMSNLIDRITRRGLVIDFIFIRTGPFHTGIFNLANVVLMIGSAVVACDLWSRRRRHTHKKSTEDQSQ